MLVDELIYSVAEPFATCLKLVLSEVKSSFLLG